MRWACPHCKTSLETILLQKGAEAAGPRPGWAYARCFQCTQFAEVELETGCAAALNTPHKPKEAAAPVVPVVEAPPDPAAIQPAFEEYLKTSLDQAPPPFLHQARPSRFPRIGSRFSVLLAGTGFLTIAAGTMMLWNAREGRKVAAESPPIQDALSALTAPAANTPLERAHSAALRLADAPASATANPEHPEEKDTIHSEAMAPRRPTPDDIQLYLQARKSTRSMELRTGPGTEFSLLGLADLDERYPVIEVKNRWFRIQLEETPGLTAWVAYERVELFSQDKIPEDAR